MTTRVEPIARKSLVMVVRTKMLGRYVGATRISRGARISCEATKFQ